MLRRLAGLASHLVPPGDDRSGPSSVPTTIPLLTTAQLEVSS